MDSRSLLQAKRGSDRSTRMVARRSRANHAGVKARPVSPLPPQLCRARWQRERAAATYHNALLITHAIAIGFCAISLYMTLVTSRSIRFNAKARFMGLFTFAACLAMIGVILYLLGTVGFDRLSAGIAFSSAATGIELIAFATLMVIWAKYSHRDESGQPITKLSTAEQARRRKENAFWKDKVAQLPVPSPPPVPANSSSKRPSQKDRPPSFASVDAEQEFGAK